MINELNLNLTIETPKAYYRKAKQKAKITLKQTEDDKIIPSNGNRYILVHMICLAHTIFQQEYMQTVTIPVKDCEKTASLIFPKCCSVEDGGVCPYDRLAIMISFCKLKNPANLFKSLDEYVFYKVYEDP